MSVFYGCENCGVRFDKPNYTFSWCEKCLTSLTCHTCGSNMTLNDHKYSMFEEMCLKCYEKEKKADYEDRPYFDKDPQELEQMWQASASMIQMLCLKSWHCDPSEEKMWRDKVEAEQERQSKIQDEITRKSRN